MEALKIDFVVPWVDGSDKDWIRDRLQLEGKDVEITDSDYRDWDIFKYWFRAVEMYAPWVNNVYLITYGHLPDFLNVDHPKLKIINHTDYIPSDYLPTFSSHTIELNMHRIEGLSEHFVYFNDDMFLNQPVTPEDFFKKGLPCDTAVINPIVPARYDTISNIMLNDIGVINQNFSKRQVIKKNPGKWYNYRNGVLNALNLIFTPWSRFPGLYQQHLPTSFLKSTFETIWEKEYDVLHQTCLHQIRDYKYDVNQWVIKEWQMCEGNFMPRSHKIGDRFLIDSIEEAEKGAQALKSKKYKMVCLNDHYGGENLEKIIISLSEAFESKLSRPCKFEK
ncbi:stealth family protein [Erysipelothrix rhusiopathiae]|nr:stealth family protein [Erysipelothrix rhusiopathiae]